MLPGLAQPGSPFKWCIFKGSVWELWNLLKLRGLKQTLKKNTSFTSPGACHSLASCQKSILLDPAEEIFKCVWFVRRGLWKSWFPAGTFTSAPQPSPSGLRGLHVPQDQSLGLHSSGWGKHSLCRVDAKETGSVLRQASGNADRLTPPSLAVNSLGQRFVPS